MMKLRPKGQKKVNFLVGLTGVSKNSGYHVCAFCILSNTFLLASGLFSSFSSKALLFSLAGKQHDVGIELVKSLQNTKYSVDEKLEKSFISLFGKKPVALSEPQEVVDRDVPLEPVGHYESDIKDADSESDDEGDTEDEIGLESLDKERAYNDQSPSKSIDDSSDEETFYASEQHHGTESNFKEQIDLHGGRVRRKAVFDNEMDIDNKVILWQVTICSDLILSCAFDVI